MKKLILTFITSTFFILGCSRDEQNIQPRTSPEQTGITQPTVAITTISPQISDFEMGSRSLADLKVDEKIFYKSIDIEELTTNKPKFTIDFLKQFITVKSSSVDELIKPVFNDEDLRYVLIHDFNYDRRGGIITFKTSYKGIISRLVSRIVFNSDMYYKYQVTINTDFVSKHYMRGIYEDIEGSIDGLLIYDHNKYSIEYRGDNANFKDDNSNCLRFTFDLVDNTTNLAVATLSSEDIRGFKELSLLSTEMKVFSTPAFERIIKQKLLTVPNINEGNLDLTSKLANTFISQNWIMLTKIEVDNNQLDWRQNYLTGRGLKYDVYLDSPRFVLESAIRDGNDLRLKITFVRANDQEIRNTYFNLVLRAIL